MRTVRTGCVSIAFCLSLLTGSIAGERDDIEAACGTQAWLPGNACGCIADKAMTDLNELQRSWLIAAVKQDQTEGARIQAEMSMNELTEVGTFMAQNTVSCQQ